MIIFIIITIIIITLDLFWKHSWLFFFIVIENARLRFFGNKEDKRIIHLPIQYTHNTFSPTQSQSLDMLHN